MAELHVLVINCGSSSIKLALLEPVSGSCNWQALGERLGASAAKLTIKANGEARTIALPDAADQEKALDVALAELPKLRLGAVGHRVVHGGEAFADSVVLDERTIQAISALSDLAPLHNPANVAGIRAALRLRPELGQVAVFDTSFHHTMPPRAYLYALPYALYEQHQVRKYGFHGTSHSYVAGRAAELLGKRLDQLNLLSAHLGNGCSATAIRAGDVDPNLHQHLVDHLGMSLSDVTELLNKRSGLLGLSGESNDMRNLLELERAGNARAGLAIEVFCYRLAKALLGLSAALPAIDALIFTGGIGEHAAPVRARTLQAMAVLGARVDPQLNDAHGRDSRGVITHESSRLCALVVPTNEELVIAREAARLITPS
jgi:acetate kinase